MLVRPAQMGDYQAICDLFREVDDLHAELLPGFFRRSKKNARSRDEVKRIVESADETILVALDHVGEVAALVHVQIYDTPPVAVMVPKRRAHIDNLVVAKGERRRGYGKRLLDAACRWAKEKRADEILLTVWAGNGSAERFYQRMGFKQVNAVLARDL